MAPPTYSIFDMCAGTGMLGASVKIALETIGIGAETVGGCERETSAAAAFMAGMEISQGWCPPIWDDATTLFSRRDRGLEPVDVLCAGYPCQPFSCAGKRDGRKDDRHIWPSIRRAVARLKPGIVFFENVDGHVSLGLWKVLRDCERLGYRVTTGVYSAKEVGATQLRKRVFILGLSVAQYPRWAGASVHTGRGSEGDGEGEFSWRVTGLGNAEHSGKGSRKPRGQKSQACGEDRRKGANSRSSELADAPGTGLESREQIESPIVGSADLSVRKIFPPGRDDYQRWASLASEGLDSTLFPAIESGVSVVADGLVSSADLLRIGGNGVCPLQAAWAMLNLFACLMEPVEYDAVCGPLFADSVIGN